MACSVCNQPGHKRSTCTNNPKSTTEFSQVLPFLGTKPDSELAKEFGLHASVVTYWRRRVGIEPVDLKKYRGPSNLDLRYPGITARLGVDRDFEIARDYGLSRQRILQYRERRNIPAPIDEKKKEIVPLLGLMPDARIARVYKLSPETVKRVRKKHNIGPCPIEYPHTDILDAVRESMGRVSDRQLAKELGIHVNIIWKYRKRNNIPTQFISPRSEGFQPLSREYITRRFHEGATDQEIADEMEASRGTIAQIRNKELKLYRWPKQKGGTND